MFLSYKAFDRKVSSRTTIVSFPFVSRTFFAYFDCSERSHQENIYQEKCKNKPGTTKVGAISKAQNCKRGTIWKFLTSIVLQNIETNEGETLWCNPKKFKKQSHSAEENPSEKHRKVIFSMFSVFEVRDVDVFVLDKVLAFRVCFGRPLFKLMWLNK